MVISRFLIRVSSQGDGQENVAMLGATAAVVKGPLLQPLRP